VPPGNVGLALSGAFGVERETRPSPAVHARVVERIACTGVVPAARRSRID
jgi:hypothetical protein